MSNYCAVREGIRALSDAPKRRRGIYVVGFKGHGAAGRRSLVGMIAGMLGLGAFFGPGPVMQIEANAPAPAKIKPVLSRYRSLRSLIGDDFRKAARHQPPRHRKYLNASRTMRPDGSEW